MEKLPFIGSFNKKLNHADREYFAEKFGFEYHFDGQKYAAVAADIAGVLGDFKEYSAQDAYAYFHRRFFAFPVDLRAYWNYADISRAGFYFDRPTVSDDEDIEALAEADGRYSYIHGGIYGGEKVFAVVIDAQNEVLCASYSALAEASDRGCRDNIIIAIGSLDGVNINSMKVLLSPGFAEVEYALEFFRRHSGNGADIMRRLAADFCAGLEKIYPHPERQEVALSTEDTYLLHIHGRGAEHAFSVKFTLFPEPAIWLYGYGGDAQFPLTPQGVKDALARAEEIINYGGVLTVFADGGERLHLEFIGAIKSNEALRAFYAEYLKKSGKYAPNNAQLRYSDFTGGREIICSAEI